MTMSLMHHKKPAAKKTAAHKAAHHVAHKPAHKVAHKTAHKVAHKTAHKAVHHKTAEKACVCKHGAKDAKKHHKKRPLSGYMKFAGPTIRRLRKEQPGHPFGWYGKETGKLWHLQKAEAEAKMKK
jgi:hypothetical protein